MSYLQCYARLPFLPAVRFANVRLQRTGRCHESEVFGVFRREHSRYRTAETLSDATLRDLVRNWHPGVERTPNGYYRNLSGEDLRLQECDRSRAVHTCGRYNVT